MPGRLGAIAYGNVGRTGKVAGNDFYSWPFLAFGYESWEGDFMIELPEHEYCHVYDWIRNSEPFRNVFVYSVLDRNQPGRVYVNDRSRPTAGIIVHRGGCYYVFGTLSDADFNLALIAFLRNPAHHASFYDLYMASGDWHALLASALEGQVVPLTRTHYRLDDDRAAFEPADIPAPYRISRIDSQSYDAYRSSVDATYDLLWTSGETYLQHAFGINITDADGGFASVCNTFFVGGGLIAPDIITFDKHRRQGLAAAACAHFIRASRERGLTPYWDCDRGNEASNRLARRLGFEKVGDVPILWRHENPDVIRNYLHKNNY